MPATIFAADVVLDGMADIIMTNCTFLYACAMGEDANTWANVSANELGKVAITSGDFTKGARSVSGRKVSFDGKAITIDDTGTVDALAFVNESGTTLYAVALPSTTIGVTGGSSTLTVNQFDLLGTPDVVAV